MLIEATNDFAEKYGVWYGSMLINFNVIRRNRSTLEIAVHPNSTVEVTAPVECTEEVIRERVKKRAGWIVRQRKWFNQFNPRTPDRQYLGGETHLYLGKRYRLKICIGETIGVRLVNGNFEVTVSDKSSSQTIQSQLELWYRNQSKRLFRLLLDEQCERYGIFNPPTLHIRAMKTRWGSLSKGGILTLNSSLIRAPKECIKYVITHELCHVTHHDHSHGFYKLLKSRMPDWEKNKQKLEEALI